MEELSNGKFSEFDEKQIQKKVQQLRQKFFKGHQKSQVKYKKGIVFIGNSRIGKSTFSALLGGIKMRRKVQNKQLVIEPLEEKHRKQLNLIQHTFTSVTSYPNIHDMQIDGKYYTLVDLPGFKDTSYQKELCNESYIKGLLQQLDQVLFVMVVKVHSENLTLGEDELGMMRRFMTAFPNLTPGQPKQNLCMIINFVENIETPQKQDAMKANIIKQIQKQLENDKILEKDKMKMFYSRSIESNRMFLIERAKNDNKKTNEEYTIPKLLPFIKSNINKFSQNKEKSQFKIDLTKCQDRKDKQLREVIWKCVKKMTVQIGQRIEVYKKMLSQLLGLLSETEGVTCGKEVYRDLENYYRQHKLSKFRGIQLPNEPLYLTKEKTIQSNQESIQDVIIGIVELFGEMLKKNDFSNLKDEFDNILKMSMKFFKVVNKLFEKVFSYASYNELLQFTENVKKSIYVDYLDIVCLVENVEEFTINQQDMGDVSSPDRYKESLFDVYNSNINRITTFKDNLAKYLSAIINKCDSQVGKVNIDVLKRIRKLFSIVHLKELESKIPIGIYKSSHIKLKDNIFFTNPGTLYSKIGEINDLQWVKDQLEKINKWKNTQQDWELIKGKNYLFFLDFLTKTGYKNKKELLEYNLNIKQFDQAINLLKSIIEDVENDTFNRLNAHDQCLKAKQKMLEAWYLSGAMKCCKLAEKLYLYEDKAKVLKAQQDYLNILKKFMVQDPTEIINEIDEYSYNLNSSPWNKISDSDYDSMLNIVYQHIQSSLLRENGYNSRNSTHEKIYKQGNVEKQEITSIKKIESASIQQLKKPLFKGFNSK